MASRAEQSRVLPSQQKATNRSPIQQKLVETEIRNGLTRAGLAYDNPIRDTLDAEVQIVGPPGISYLRIGDERGAVDW